MKVLGNWPSSRDARPNRSLNGSESLSRRLRLADHENESTEVLSDVR